MFETSNDALLAGVIVVEHGKGVAASYAGRILALMGATVIKLEVPGRKRLAMDHGEPILGIVA